MSEIRALLFDFDGLIADTESMVYETWRATYEDHGHILAIEEWAECVGSDWSKYSPEDQLDELVGRKLDWPALRAAMKMKEASLLTEIKPLPGVVALLEEAKVAQVGLAVASSSPHSWVDPLIERLGLSDFFEAIVCLEDAGKAKPDPGLFLEGTRKLGREPSECLVLEDSLNGLRAAQSAGSPCCVIPNPITAHLDFGGAALRLNSLAETSLGDLLQLG